MSLSKNARYLLEKRYCRQGESAEDVFKRSAEALALGDGRFEEKLYDAMIGGTFLPNSPCLFNSGLKDGNLSACFALPIEDDLKSIFNTVAHMAYIFQTGGGVGINFSPLREEGAVLSKGGVSSGAISFMSNFNQAVDTVKQGGRRRGALMGILNYNHPEILNFVRAKLQGKLENFNLSILVDDSFMKLVDTNEKISLKSPLGYEVDKIKAKDLFDLSCWVAWSCGDPAFLFQDRVNKDNPFIKEFVLDTCNPCSEVFLPHYGACTLGSLNIQKFIWKNDFNFERFEEFCKLGMRALTNINKISFYPLYQIKECMDKYNPVGLGIMGFADCLIRLGINYDSKDCLDFIDKVGSSWKKATEEFAGDTFYFYKRVIAPTGSLSILGDCSSGIEPVYDTTFERRLTVGVIEETRELYKSKFVRTAYQVSPEWHVKVLARWQKWADGGISKTINLPYNCSADDVKNAFIMAWKMGCKGVSIFRDRSRSQVLISTSSSHQPWAGKCSDAECSL